MGDKEPNKRRKRNKNLEKENLSPDGKEFTSPHEPIKRKDPKRGPREDSSGVRVTRSQNSKVNNHGKLVAQPSHSQSRYDTHTSPKLSNTVSTGSQAFSRGTNIYDKNDSINLEDREGTSKVLQRGQVPDNWDDNEPNFMERGGGAHL